MCLAFAFSIAFTNHTYAQTTDWAISCGGVQSDKGISIGTDSLGYIYISGFYNGTAFFGNDTLVASYSTNKNIFLAKLDSLGNFMWAVDGTGGPYDDRALGMYVDKAGNAYLTGTFWGYVDFDGVSANGNGYDSSLLVKFNTNGVCQWARSFGANTGGPCPWPMYDGDDHSYDVQVDDDGFIYVTGFWSGDDADFDGFTLVNPDWDTQCQPAGYVGKLDSLGNFIWVRQFDGIEDQRGSRDNRIAIDKYSNVYVTGGFEGVGIYGPGTSNPLSVTAVDGWDVFLFKTNKDGDFLWVKNVGSNKDDRGAGIAVDRCGDVYISGEYRNPMVFPGANASNGGDTLSHKRKRDVFVAKCNTDGDWLWAKRARSEKKDKAYQMSVDDGKQVFICGEMSGEGKFNDNISITNADTNMIAFVAQLDGDDGDWIWAKSAGGISDNDRASDVVSDNFGNAYAVGFFEDDAHFDNYTLTSLGKKDIFIWKIKAVLEEFNYTNTYDTTIINNIVCDPILAGIVTSKDTITYSCDTTFIDTVTNYILDPDIQVTRFRTELYEESCWTADTGLFVLYADTTFADCDTIIVDTVKHVTLLPSIFNYNAYTYTDSACSPLDTGFVLISSDTVFRDCDTLVNEIFTHYIPTIVPNCDDGDCKTLDTYDPLSCTCIHQEVVPNECIDVYFPTAFTPDSDGLNEAFKPIVQNTHLIQDYLLNIYSRWGGKIFSTTEIETGWGGEKEQTGVYTWVIFLTDINGKTKKVTGHVTLLK